MSARIVAVMALLLGLLPNASFAQFKGAPQSGSPFPPNGPATRTNPSPRLNQALPDPFASRVPNPIMRPAAPIVRPGRPGMPAGNAGQATSGPRDVFRAAPWTYAPRYGRLSALGGSGYYGGYVDGGYAPYSYAGTVPNDQAPLRQGRLSLYVSPLSSQVFTRWLTDSRFRGADGAPRPLPRTGARRSFEALCRELSNDVHPRTVLDELLRLGLVELDGEQVVARTASFVPAARLDEMTAMFSSNAADHLAAAVSNLTLRDAPFLEQSVYADGLTAESIDVLHQAARQAWTQAFEAVVKQARERVDGDQASDGALRMRFGTYFFSEPVAAPERSSAPAPGARPARRAAAEPTHTSSSVRRAPRPKKRS